jgi:molybdenum cofactor biosynthesis protein MoaC
MVDVSAKSPTVRIAIAEAWVILSGEAYRLLKKNQIAKGDVLTVAQVAGIQAAKRTHELIPLCHPLPIHHIELNFRLDDAKESIQIRSQVKLSANTGAEMEALVAVTIAALTIYDMCKAVDKGIIISGIQLLEKTGGKSGVYKKKL